jgi:hypothetical protein
VSRIVRRVRTQRPAPNLRKAVAVLAAVVVAVLGLAAPASAAVGPPTPKGTPIASVTVKASSIKGKHENAGLDLHSLLEP